MVSLSRILLSSRKQRLNPKERELEITHSSQEGSKSFQLGVEGFSAGIRGTVGEEVENLAFIGLDGAGCGLQLCQFALIYLLIPLLKLCSPLRDGLIPFKDGTKR